jgi:hypothetical protein
MHKKRVLARRVLGVELLERRLELSVSGLSGNLAAAAALRAHHTNQGFTALYLTKLTPAPGVASTDRASGFVSLQLNHDATAMNVTVTLSKISNVSGIVLHYTVPPFPPNPPAEPATYQTVAVLLAPAAGSGPLRLITIHGSLSRFGLIGPLTGRPLTAFIREMQLGQIQVVVLTNNGVDGTTPLPGNYATGEIQGTLHRK